MTAAGDSPVWRKARRCSSVTNCVEVAAGPDLVLLRDSTDPDGPCLVFAVVSWRQFLAGIRAGEFGP